MKLKIVIYLIIGILPLSGYACSAFKYVNDEQVYVAKNFDWFSGQRYVLKNSSNQSKCTYLMYEGKNTCWTSKYGSVTFNQNGKEFPYGGINEKGLVVEMLWLKETQYKENTINASTISELEWIQYQLDNYKTVDEIITNLNKLKIDPITSTIHYFVSDQTGNSAVIEFLNEELVITESIEKVQAVTNGSNGFNTGFYEKNKSKFEKEYIPKKMQSPLRYCSVRNNAEKIENEFNTQTAFEILDKVSENREEYKTHWTIVYDLTNLKITFKTFNNKTEKQIDLSQLDFESKSTSYYDMSSDDANRNVNTLMTDYSPEYNYKLIQDCIQPNLAFNYTQLNAHQINPVKSNVDTVFSNNHTDIIVEISTKIPTGTVRYFLADSETNFRRQGPHGGSVEINSNSTIHKLYSLPINKKYAFGAMHDVNGNGYLDRNFMKMPKEPFAFSGKKRFFFIPPKYKKAKFDLTKEITIKIK